MSTSECSAVKKRVKFDARKGKTTSVAMVEFIRRTCSCAECSEWRAARRVNGATTNAR